MRSFKLGLAAATVICAFATSAHADCVKVQTMGQGLTHGIAELFATKGLANTIYGQGRVGNGPVTTKCDDAAAMTTCHSSQTACKVTSEKPCLGAWLCF